MTRCASLVLSCEHAGNDVPGEYARIFRGCRRILESHRGYDPGALEIAEFLSAFFGVPLISHPITRLLVEPNRSPGHPQLFSEITSSLDQIEKMKILETWYHPHRIAVETAVRAELAMPSHRPATLGGSHAGNRVSKSSRQNSRDVRAHPVVHVGVHTFTPVLDGEVRRADAGLLYDPGRSEELCFCRRWQRIWRELAPGFAVKRNYPYRGIADSLVTYLRRVLPASSYLGIELEINQSHIGTAGLKQLKEDCAKSLEAALALARS